MAMHKVPTLILGIGGIGCRIAANINQLLRPEDRDHIAIVGMDTNVVDLKKLEAQGIRTVQTSDDRTVADYLTMHPEHRTWFPVTQYTVSRGMLTGAGQIRAISRLGALAAEENGKFVSIKEEIQRIRVNRGESGSGNMTVMVVGSITGGTGAGLFLQMPYYIRKLMKNEAGLNVIVRGMFIGPDLTVDVQPSNINKAAVRVNAYACLKELNALYMLQSAGEGKGKLRVDFMEPRKVDPSILHDMQKNMAEASYLDGMDDIDSLLAPDAMRADAAVIAKGNPSIPYDYLYLIEGSDVSGGIGNPSLDSVEGLAARMVHTLMFTPISDNALSVEDNMVLKDMETGGMNRYSSAGLSRLVYPRDLAREYVALCTVRDLVKDEWMLLDDAYNSEVIEARSRQKTDGQVVIPTLQDSFVAQFERQTGGKGKLGELFKEAYVITETKEKRTRSTDYLDKLDELIQDILKTDEVTAAATACALNSNKMTTYQSAIQESSRVYSAMDEFAVIAQELVKQKPASLANEMFPPSWQSMKGKSDSEYSIYGLLSKVHPLTARFFCYDLLRQMQEQCNELEGGINSFVLSSYLSDDFDTDEAGVQVAAVALKKKKNKKIPVIGDIIGDEAGIKKIRIRLDAMTNTHVELVKKYISDGLKLAALQILIERVKALAENYRIFFQSIGTKIDENTQRIAALESLGMPIRQMGVYCSKEAMQTMAMEYRNSMDITLPEDTKISIFESIFRIQAEEFDRMGKAETERQKAAYAAKKFKKLDEIFRKSIVETIETDVVKNGSGIVDMSIYQALEKQYELDVPECDFDVYVRQTIEKAMRMAAPMLATTTNAMAQNTETVYLALHPDAAASQMGEISEGATQNRYIPQACEATDGVRAKALIDEAFSPFELVCFKARYKFSIEDLIKYGPGSENERAYRTRISKLGTKPVETGDAEVGKTVVNPHLDRFWHEEAYLPSIYEAERGKNRIDTYKAFVYGLGLDYFARIYSDSTLDDNGAVRKIWCINDANGRDIPVSVRGGVIGASFNDLYTALFFNGRVKQDILRQAMIVMRAEKGYYVAQELQEKILTLPLIEDLTQPTVRDDDEEMNMLDIFLQMRDAMDPDEWKNLFTGLREVLWEFCGYLFDKNERLVNESVRAIMEKMFANSKLGAKPEAELTYGERELVRMKNTVCDKIYRRS